MQIEKISRENLFKLENDYIFHGSPKLFDVAKPHHAKCDSKNPLNEQTAIYGANDLRFAIIFAFEKSPRQNYSWTAEKENGVYVGKLENGTYVDENAKGYLYCFEKSKFTPTSQNGEQYVCMEELKPQRIFELSYKDFSDFFVKTIRKETLAKSSFDK